MDRGFPGEFEVSETIVVRHRMVRDLRSDLEASSVLLLTGGDVYQQEVLFMCSTVP